jgi:hypothetical protein
MAFQRSDRVPGWPSAGDGIVVSVSVKVHTRRGLRRCMTIFPARLWGLQTICVFRVVRILKKSPDAVFRGEVALPDDMYWLAGVLRIEINWPTGID